MVLEVEFEDFAQEIDRRFGVREAYVTATAYGSQVTAADPKIDLVVFARTSMTAQKAKDALEAQTVSVRKGAWVAEDEMSREAMLIDSYVVAVAYKSKEEMPGLWVDAFASEPTMHDVLITMLNEFREAGEVGDIELDDFTRAIDPNVLIVSPETLHGYLERKASVQE